MKIVTKSISKQMFKIGKYDVYVEETNPGNYPDKIEHRVTVHDPKTRKSNNLGYYPSKDEALKAAEDFCSKDS